MGNTPADDPLTEQPWWPLARSAECYPACIARVPTLRYLGAMRHFVPFLVLAAVIGLVALWRSQPPPETVGQRIMRECRGDKDCYDRELIAETFKRWQRDQ